MKPMMITKLFATALAAVLFGALCAGCAEGHTDTKEYKSSAKEYAIVEASYPTMVQYPTASQESPLFSSQYDSWRKDWRERTSASADCQGARDEYYAAVIPALLTGAGDENRACSPLNIYMALAMLAETTDGESREQILALLGCESVEESRALAEKLFKANYRDDGVVTLTLADSLWMRDGMSYDKKVLETLAESYYASSFSGEMGSDGYNKMLQAWLNNNTGGLLKDYADNVTLEPETLLALASTVYFKATWGQKFNEANTVPQTFHALSGDIEFDFMNQKMSGEYYWADNFGAVNKYFDMSGGAMWLILPDEGTTPDEVLNNPQLYEMIRKNYDWEDKSYQMINLALPKFDIASDIDLTSALVSLGVTDVFDPQKADFSAVLPDFEDEVWLSKAEHAARVKVDEEGCEAAAYTVLALSGAGMPPTEEIDFVLDRPFIFIVTTADGSISFAGTVYNP